MKDDKKTKMGKVHNCELLNVRSGPSLDSESVYIIDAGSEVLIDEESSTESFYKIITASGVDRKSTRLNSSH